MMRPRDFMVLMWIVLSISAVPGQDLTLTNRAITFTNLEGRVYKSVDLVRANLDGVIWRDDNGSGGQISYTNLAPEFLSKIGVPVERVSAARERAQRKLTPAPATPTPKAPFRQTVEQYLSSHAISVSLWTPGSFNFPENEQQKKGCRAILSELKQMRKAIELGVSYNGFSELIQQKAMAIEKLKDDYPNIPHGFVLAVDNCVQDWSDAKRDWWNKIKAESGSSKEALDEYFFQRDLAMAEVPFYSCKAIAEISTNTDPILEAEAGVMLLEQNHHDYNDYAPILVLDKDQLVTQLKASLEALKTKADKESKP